MKVNRELLKITMARKCMSARDVSNITGLAPSSITKLLQKDTDKIRPKTIGLVAKALEIEASDLIILN